MPRGRLCPSRVSVSVCLSVCPAASPSTNGRLDPGTPAHAQTAAQPPKAQVRPPSVPPSSSHLHVLLDWPPPWPLGWPLREGCKYSPKEGSQKGGQETSNTRTNTAPSPREFPGGVASAFKIELEILRVLQFCLSRVSSSLSLKAHFLVPPGPAAIVLARLHGGLCWAAGLLTPQSPYPPRPRAAWGRVHLPPPS